MPNNPIWGHLKWVFRPFAPNNAIWGQVSKALSELLDKQKSICYLKFLDSYKACRAVQVYNVPRCPQLTIFDTMSSKFDSKYTNALYLALNLGASDNPACVFGSPDYKFKTTSPIHISTKQKANLLRAGILKES